MKRITITLISMLFALTLSAQTTYVLLAGVSNYGTGNPEHNLQSTTRDVKDMTAIFKQFPNTKTVTITSKYATAENITKKLNAILTLAKKNDRIFFFFSGHGGDDNMVCYQGGLYNYGSLMKLFAKAKTDQVYAFIDCCNAGCAKKYADDATYTANHPMTFFLASRGEEYSKEDASLLRNGYFTQALLKGLRGMSDSNEDRAVTVSELYKYVYNEVVKINPEQHPQLVSSKDALDAVILKW